MSNIEEILDENWDEIKGDIKAQWNKLKRKDITDIEGSYEVLVDKLQKAYGYTKKQVEEELDEFFSSGAIEDIKENIKDATEENTESLKNTMDKYLHDHLESIKSKTHSLTENIKSYSKDNPLKILGAVATASFILTKILSSSKKS